MAGPGATRRETQRQETRQSIYDAAMDLFTRKGFTRVSVDEICEKVGISKGTFYYYFRSKDQVLLEEFHKIEQLQEEWLERLSKKHRSPSLILVEFTGLCFAHLKGLGVKTLKVIYCKEIDPTAKKPKRDPADQPLYTIVERLIEEGQEKGEMRADIKARSMAALWVRCYRGTAYEWCLRNGRFDLVEAGDEFAKMLVEYLRGGVKGTARRR